MKGRQGTLCCSLRPQGLLAKARLSAPLPSAPESPLFPQSAIAYSRLPGCCPCPYLPPSESLCCPTPCHSEVNSLLSSCSYAVWTYCSRPSVPPSVTVLDLSAAPASGLGMTVASWPSVSSCVTFIIVVHIPWSVFFCSGDSGSLAAERPALV